MIRFIKETDIERVYEIYSYYVTYTEASLEIEAPTLEQFRKRVKSIMKTYPYIVYESKDKNIIGFAYATKFMDREGYKYSVTTSIYLDPHFLGKGKGEHLYKSLLALLNVQGFYTAYAIVTKSNEKSMDFHEKIGFEPVAELDQIGYKFNKWIDTIYYAYPIKSLTKFPEPIKSINTIDFIKFF
ncbi:MAG: hypothetical protein ATN31_11025 [Candidatus Epulonipiscioides saccharophilum]|nr:MAG: hypothetical protein ATN31_11025 [Epulopiscium sp. AS2M-Bin001]